jgi:hypothetical protein
MGTTTPYIVYRDADVQSPIDDALKYKLYKYNFEWTFYNSIIHHVESGLLALLQGTVGNSRNSGQRPRGRQ